jgi:proteasome lid subunit RPN8/RPN11
MWGSEARRIGVPVTLWVRLLLDIRRRGHDVGESGAFIFGRTKVPSLKAVDYVAYDDFDPDVYQNGTIAFHAAGYAALWKFCRERGLEVLCDVHTHPGGDVRQSQIDQRHPMLPLVGHTAMIVPCFGQAPWRSLKTVGVYEYLGNFQWRTHAPSPDRRVKLSLW